MSSEETKPEVKPEVKPLQTPIIKNPKRVEAGKKGAEARWLKKKMQQPSASEITKKQDISEQDNSEHTEKKEPEIPMIINVYKKNYIQSCFIIIGIVGLGLYIYNDNKNKLPVHPAQPDTFDF
jgi:hypothetical protein